MGTWVHELLYLRFELAFNFVVSIANLSESRGLNSANHLVFRVLNFPLPLSVNSILSIRFSFCAALKEGLFPCSCPFLIFSPILLCFSLLGLAFYLVVGTGELH